jgi:hypothetical protein
MNSRKPNRRVGTIERIAMRPDDDLKLGKILKQSGAKQQVVSGHNLTLRSPAQWVCVNTQ